MELFSSIDYLAIAVANGYGLDKELWRTRIEWTNANWSNIYSYLPDAEEPCLMLGAIQALEKAKKGLPIGYPISLDATSSGPQILACLSRCPASAKLCNVLDTGRREDLYTNIYNVMLADMGQQAKIERSHVKKAIMTAFYGSEATPKRVFGEGIGLIAFEKAMSTEASGAWGLNKLFLELWNPKALEYSWVLPDNFHVHCKVECKEQESFTFDGGYYQTVKTVNKAQPKGRSIGANVTHSLDAFVLREIIRRSNYDSKRVKYIRWCNDTQRKTMVNYDQKTQMLITLLELGKKSGFYSARILNYIESYNISLISKEVINELLESLAPKPFKTITIHDCFRVHPNYGNSIRKLYSLMLAYLWRSNMLEYLLYYLTDKNISLGDINRELWRDVANSNYSLS